MKLNPKNTDSFVFCVLAILALLVFICALNQIKPLRQDDVMDTCLKNHSYVVCQHTLNP